VARWGKLSTWLKFHIITGITGPYMVLLHTSWKFNGLAGVLLLFTIIIVASGFIGRYIYTAIPRTADGAEMEAAEVEQLIFSLEAEIKTIQSSTIDQSGNKKLITRQFKDLNRRRQVLRTQMNSLAAARRLLSLWHIIHIPSGLLFTTAFFHIVGAFIMRL
jgi:hypothetical protein